ncbi:MAG: hypothetical protein ACFE8F_06910 [Promethearchaeota archaeon]
MNQSLPTVSAMQAPVNSITAFRINASYPTEYFDVPVSQAGVYQFNVSVHVDSGLPVPGPGVSVSYGASAEMWYPHIGGIPEYFSFSSASWWPQSENTTRWNDQEEIAVQAGSFRLEVGMFNTDPNDQISGNVTVTEQLVFSTLSFGQALGQNSTIRFTEDYSWMGLRMHLPGNDLYNLTAFGEMNWATTAGWTGDASFTPFNDLMLIDLKHGRNIYYDFWGSASFNIPAGADTNSTTWGPRIDLEPLEAGEYFLIGKTNAFEFLNGSFVDFTINVSPVPTQILYPSVPLQLGFNTTPNVYDTYLAVTIPEGNYFSFDFSNPVGQNWTVMAYDAWTGAYSGPLFQTHADPTTHFRNKDNLEYGWATAMSMGTPAPGLLGDWYAETWVTDSTYSIYVNGTNVTAIPLGGMGATSRFNTFYFRVIATPLGTPTTTFRINANFELTPFPQLTPIGLTFDFNSTVGPFYHIFQVPQASGAIYTVKALATNYTSAGTIYLEDLPQSKEYENWQWMMIFGSPIAYAEPATGLGVSVNTNATATLSYISVKDGMNYLWIQGPGMVGGDMTEGSVSLTTTAPIPYPLGTIATAIVAEKQFATYTFNVEAGITYYFELTLKADGEQAFGYFLDPYGYSPFVTGSFVDLFIGVSTSMPFGMTYIGTFTATYTGRVSFVMVGGPLNSLMRSPVEFFILAVVPVFSMAMISVIVLTAIIMVAVGILVGYFLAKRRFSP